MRALCFPGREEGRHREGLSSCQSTSLSCYLDSNYTCQLSLRPSSVSLSLSVCLFKPSHTPFLCVQQDYALILFLSLFMCNLPLCQSVLRSCRFSTALPLCIRCCFNPLLFVLSLQGEFNSRQISNMVKANSEVIQTLAQLVAVPLTLTRRFLIEPWEN